jgi:RNA polymerase sigma-70 factor (ECF subfamily)
VLAVTLMTWRSRAVVEHQFISRSWRPGSVSSQFLGNSFATRGAQPYRHAILAGMGDGGDRSSAERLIAEACARGDPRAAAVVGLRAYGDEILGYLRRLARDEEIAQDAFSDFCERMWRAIGNFRQEASFRTWAYTLAWSAHAAQARDPYRRRGRRAVDDELAQVAAEIRQSTAPHLKSAARDRLHAAREALDAEQRSLLILRVEKRLPWREIAAIMSADGPVVTEGALKKRLERIREQLRALVQDAPGRR